MAFPCVVQRSLELVRTPSPALPPLEGVTPNFRPELQQSEWLSPTQLKALQPMLPLPTLPAPEDATPAVTPITREDFAAWAAEFGDTATLARGPKLQPLDCMTQNGECKRRPGRELARTPVQSGPPERSGATCTLVQRGIYE